MNAKWMTTVALVAALSITPALARDGSKSVSDRPAGHAALSREASTGKHTPAKKQEAAKLDALYSQEVAAFNDFISTGGKISSFISAQLADDAYQGAVTDARNAKTINRSYKTQPTLADIGQTPPDDLNNDGYADTMSGDTGAPSTDGTATGTGGTDGGGTVGTSADTGLGGIP